MVVCEIIIEVILCRLNFLNKLHDGLFAILTFNDFLIADKNVLVFDVDVRLLNLRLYPSHLLLVFEETVKAGLDEGVGRLSVAD